MSTASPNWADAPHLVRRFFAAWRPSSLTPSEQLFAADLLRDAERELFWNQQLTDLRHAVDCAEFVRESQPMRRDLMRAALLHDLGKRNARLGPIGRSIATIAAAVRIRGSTRHRSYTRHAHEGAELLAAGGAEPLVVSYTRHHHGPRPGDIDPEDWELLMAADRMN